MSNSGGGVIIFGVDDNGQRVGLKQTLLDLMDPAKINGQIEPKAPGARVNTSYYEFTFYRLRYGFLCIHSQDDLIIFEKEWGYNKPNGRHQTVIREGVLYARGVGETRPARQADISLMVRRLIETGSKALLSKIEMVATLPLDSGIIALDPESEGRGIRLVASGHGQPVKIVPESESAIPVVEVNDADLPFSSKQAEIINQVRIWKAGHPEHRVQRSTLNQWYLARGELQISDDMAEFCFVSAGYGHGYPIYWASVMSGERLDSVLQREVTIVKYSMRQVLPYVVGALRFSQRKDLLASRLDSFRGAIRSARKVLRIATFEEFRCSARIKAGYFQLLAPIIHGGVCERRAGGLLTWDNSEICSRSYRVRRFTRMVKNSDVRSVVPLRVVGDGGEGVVGHVGVACVGAFRRLDRDVPGLVGCVRRPGGVS